MKFEKLQAEGFKPRKFYEKDGQIKMVVAFKGTRSLGWWERLLYRFGKRNFDF